MVSPDFLSALRALRNGGVDFILVGGMAAVLNGAPVNTFAVDIVHSRREDNLENLLRVLDSIDAIYRMQPSRRLKPGMSHVSSPGYHNLVTKYGHLDVLGTVGRQLGYEDLLPHSTEMNVGDGLSIQVLNLETIVALKEELAGEKDLAVLPILRRTLEEKRLASNASAEPE